MPTHIQIDDLRPRVDYSVITATTGPFAFNFPVFSEDDIFCFVDGARIALHSDYSVALTPGYVGGFPGGVLTLVEEVENAIVIIGRSLVIKRTVDFQPSGPLQSNVLNGQLDRIVAMVQELSERTLKLRLQTTFGDLTLPDPEAGQLLRWRTDQTGLENTTATIPVGSFALASQPEAEAGTRDDVLMSPLRATQHLAARTPDIVSLAQTTVRNTLRPLVSDLHYGALRGVGWVTGEAGGEVVYSLANSAALGATALTLVAGPVPVADQLLVLRGTDGEFYSASVLSVVLQTVNLRARLPVAVSVGANCHNFYNNESHPNEWGYRAIADHTIREKQAYWREVYKGAPVVLGTSTVAETGVDSCFFPGSTTVKGYDVTPTAANSGCIWIFNAQATGHHRAVLNVNTIDGADLIFRVSLDNVGLYQKTIRTIDSEVHHLEFNVSSPGLVEIRLLRASGVFITSKLIVQRGGEDRFALFEDSGRYICYGDSWFALASDNNPAHFGIIDRFRERFPGATFINKGVGGDTGADLYARFAADVEGDITANGPATAVLILGGTNDYFNGATPAVFGNYLGFLVSRTIELGTIPVLFTPSVGSAAASAARFNLSRRYVDEIPYHDLEPRLRVRRYSISTRVPASATVPVLSLGRRTQPFKITESYLSHACAVNEGTTQPAGTNLATIAAGLVTIDATVTPSAARYLQVLRTAGGADESVSGYIDLEEEEI